MYTGGDDGLRTIPCMYMSLGSPVLTYIGPQGRSDAPKAYPDLHGRHPDTDAAIQMVCVHRITTGTGMTADVALQLDPAGYYSSVLLFNSFRPLTRFVGATAWFK